MFVNVSLSCFCLQCNTILNVYLINLKSCEKVHEIWEVFISLLIFFLVWTAPSSVIWWRQPSHGSITVKTSLLLRPVSSNQRPSQSQKSVTPRPRWSRNWTGYEKLSWRSMTLSSIPISIGWIYNLRYTACKSPLGLVS